MYLRTTPRRNNDGSVVRYLQLAHNIWDAQAKRSRVQVLYNFGREDANNRAALQRLVASVARFLDPDRALAATAGEGLEFIESRPLGGIWALEGLWHRLGIDTTMRRLLTGRRLDPSAERVLFALVANRALAPSSKLAAAGWVNEDVAIDGLPATSDDACYRAMDWLLEIHAVLEREVFGQVANLLNLEVDLLFFDTTSTYFETDEPDEPVARDQRGHRLPQPTGGDGDGQQAAGFRSYGKSKDHRDDLPQIVVGMAVTRTGIPVRVWCWPGNTSDQVLIRQVKADLRDWTLARVIWVADRGFASAENRRYLRKGDHHDIIGEKLRSGSAEATAALQRQGRYQQVAGNLRVKEVKISDAERFVICSNPEQADRDASVRERLLAQLQETIAASDKLPTTKRAELRGVISTKPGLHRYLRVTPSGLLRTDQRAIKAETNLDGKYLAANQRSPPVGRGHRAGLQAAAAGRTRLARPETGHRPAPGLPPQGRPHPRPCAAVLAGVAADPDHRDDLRRHLAKPSPRTGTDQAWHLRRPRRDLPAAHRAHHHPARHPGQAPTARTPTRLAAHPAAPGFLTRANARA